MDPDFASVVLRLADTDFGAALERAQPILEAVIDSLSFQMQAALHVISLDLLDVTPELVEGEERDTQQIANPDATILPKFLAWTIDMRWQEHTVPAPILGTEWEADDKLRMALWWYVKSLAVPFVADKFLCLWIALEVLWERNGPRVEVAFTPNCGHEIKECPTCGETVARQTRGAGLRQYLIDTGGISKAHANRLWRLRQVVHGKNVFTQGEATRMAQEVNQLRAIVLADLKDAMNVPPDVPPAMVQVDGPVIGPSPFLMGHCTVSAEDVRLERDQLQAMRHT